MSQLSSNFWLRIGCFINSLHAGEFKYPEDVAMALDELALAAWKEVRELYPPSHMIDGEIVDDRPSPN